MNLTPYVENLRGELAVAADAGGEDARAVAERLTAPLESAVRLMLLDALSAAADEITRELAPGSVELRLRSGEPDFVVTPAPSDEPLEPAPDEPPPAPPGGRRGSDRAHQPPPPRATQGPHRAGREPASGCPSTPGSCGPRPPRSRPTTPARGRAPGGWARATPAGCADRAHPLPEIEHMPSNLTRQEGTPMPTFDTPEPITATIDLGHRRGPDQCRRPQHHVVDVQPSDASSEEDRELAEQTRVEYANEQLLVKTPKLRSLAAASAAFGRRDDRAARRLARPRQPRASVTSTATVGSATCRIKTGLGHGSGSTRPTRST